MKIYPRWQQSLHLHLKVSSQKMQYFRHLYWKETIFTADWMNISILSSNFAWGSTPWKCFNNKYIWSPFAIFNLKQHSHNKTMKKPSYIFITFRSTLLFKPSLVHWSDMSTFLLPIPMRNCYFLIEYELILHDHFNSIYL